MWIAPQLRCRPGVEPGSTIPAPACRLDPGFRWDDEIFGYVPVTSGLHPTPDVSLRLNNRHYVPGADLKTLHLRRWRLNL
jgi:hypothetical protein